MEFFISLLHRLSKYGSTTRSFAKYLLRSITGKCELERLAQSGKHGFKECQEIEYSLYHSQHENIRRILVADKLKIKDAMQTILRIKRIIPEKEMIFLSSMPKFLGKIVSYNALLTEVDKHRASIYDEENEKHEEMLYKLWSIIKGDNDKLDERHTSRWTEIGFQGKNPATDFRGMGVLSLMNLLFLFEKFADVGMKIYGQSTHPNYGFSFAIVGINFTGTAFELLRNGKLKGYLYNLDEESYSLENYQNFFVKIFGEFADYWHLRQPPNIMSFNEIKSDYIKEVNRRLEQGLW